MFRRIIFFIHYFKSNFKKTQVYQKINDWVSFSKFSSISFHTVWNFFCSLFIYLVVFFFSPNTFFQNSSYGLINYLILYPFFSIVINTFFIFFFFTYLNVTHFVIITSYLISISFTKVTSTIIYYAYTAYLYISPKIFIVVSQTLTLIMEFWDDNSYFSIALIPLLFSIFAALFLFIFFGIWIRFFIFLSVRNRAFKKFTEDERQQQVDLMRNIIQSMRKDGVEVRKRVQNEKKRGLLQRCLYDFFLLVYSMYCFLIFLGWLSG